jgi:hypothetical protein
MPNVCGDRGFVRIDPSDLADIGRWELNIENNVPEFCHSGTNGFNITLKGKGRGECNFEQILNTDDAVYAQFETGDLVTLLLYETEFRFWTFPARIKTIGETVEINQATEEVVRCTAVAHGAWTYPDGTVASGANDNPYGDPDDD